MGGVSKPVDLAHWSVGGFLTRYARFARAAARFARRRAEARLARSHSAAGDAFPLSFHLPIHTSGNFPDLES